MKWGRTVDVAVSKDFTFPQMMILKHKLNILEDNTPS